MTHTACSVLSNNPFRILRASLQPLSLSSEKLVTLKDVRIQAIIRTEDEPLNYREFCNKNGKLKTWANKNSHLHSSFYSDIKLHAYLDNDNFLLKSPEPNYSFTGIQDHWAQHPFPSLQREGEKEKDMNIESEYFPLGPNKYGT